MNESNASHASDPAPQAIARVVLQAVALGKIVVTRVEPDGRWTLFFVPSDETVRAAAVAAGIPIVTREGGTSEPELGPALPPLVPPSLDGPTGSPFPAPVTRAILEVIHRGGTAFGGHWGARSRWGVELEPREHDPALEALLADAGFLRKPPSEEYPDDPPGWRFVEAWLPPSERDAARSDATPPEARADRAARDALFRAIVAAPEDDAPRLAYAEHCAAAGDPARAEFIRLHCAFERMTPADPTYESSYQRLTQLADQHLAGWAGDAARVVTPASLRRGFVEGVRGTPWDVVDAASPLLDLVPVLDLAFVDAESTADFLVEELAEHPLLARLRRLDFAGNTSLGAGPLCAMLTSPRVARLATVSLFDGECSPETARVVADHLPDTVRSVGFVGFLHTTFNDASTALLAASPRMARVEEFVLYNCNLGPEGARSLAASPHLGALRDLRLGLGQHTQNRILAEGVAALVGSATLRKLQLLDLDFNDIGDAGLARLAESGGLPSLTRLRLQANQLTDKGVAALFASPRGHALESIDLAHNELGVAAVEALVRTAPRSLRRLWLMGNELGDEGARVLAESPWVAQLEELNIDGVGITDAGAALLARSPHLAKIPRLACAMQSDLSQASVRLLQDSLSGHRWHRRFTDIRMLG